MDSWRMAEIRGTLYSLLLKVDTQAGESEEMQAAQDLLQEALKILDELATKRD